MQKQNVLAMAILCMFAVQTLVAQPGPRMTNVDHISRKWLDISYATQSTAQKLDIYLPEQGDGPFPVILSVHGGAFKMGDKRDGQVTPMLKGLERDYAVVSINYRLSGEAIWPAQIQDCKAAVRRIRANASEYKLDGDNIAAWGGSAGGHLSAMLGTSGDVEDLEDLTQGNANYSSRVQAVVDWFGPTNFLEMDKLQKQSEIPNPQLHSIPNSPESELVGGNLEDVPDRVQSANPETYISADDPPFLIQHGTEDNLVPHLGSLNLARKLGKELGWQNVSLELFPATGHGGPAFQSEKNLERVFQFLDDHLKNKH